MRDISNFGNNLRDEIIEYRLEHEAGYSIKRKFVDEGDETSVCFSLYSKSGDLLSDSESVPFDPAGQRVIDDVKLIKRSDEGRNAEYEIKVTFKGSRDPIYCPIDDILTALRKQLSNKVTIDLLDNSKENESSVITSKIYNTSGEELSEDHIILDDIKMTAQNISMIADAESEEAEPTPVPTPVFVADVKDKKVTVHDLDVKNNINISKAKIDALEVTGDVKLGTKRVEEGVEPALVVNTTDKIVTVGHRLETKGSADFRSDVSVNGTLMATSLAAANNTLSVNDSSVSVIGNTRINGDIILTNSNHEREVSLTDNDFTINLMGESNESVTNKKYVNDLVNDYMSGARLASGISITADGQLKIGDTALNEATLIKLIALAERESMTEIKEK